MHFEEHGRRDNPTIIGVPGLLGGIEDFVGMVPDWKERFHVVLLDPNFERRQRGLSNITAQDISEVSYDSTSDDVAEVLKRVGKSQAIIVGVSLGGKIVYDFAIKYPQHFAGGVSIDVGPGSFADTVLYTFIENLSQKLDMTMPWPEMKEELTRRISDRNLRLLLQTQIHYPDRKPPAVWKTGMQNFEQMLENQSIDDQFEELEKIDERLASEGRMIHILQAEELCGIGEKAVEKIKQLRSLKLHATKGTSHFMHISHKHLVIDLVNQIEDARAPLARDTRDI